MKILSFAVILTAIIPSAVIAMVMKDGEILFTREEVLLLTTRIKDQDDAVEDMAREIASLKERLKRHKNDSCA